jgi:hypothetical protein
MSTPAPAAPASPAAPAAPNAPAGGEPKPGATGSPAPDAGGASPKPGEEPKPGESAAQTAARKKKYKVEGAEVEVDLADEKSLDVLIQKGLAADRRFTEASKFRKDSEALLSALQRDPMAVLARVAKMNGGDARKIVEDWLYKEHVQLESLSPEEKERELEKRELQQRREQDKVREEQAKAAKHEEAVKLYRGHYEKEVIQALQDGGLPKTPRTVERMAHYILDARKAGVKLSAKDVLPLVRQDYEQEFRELMGPMNGDVLAGLLGDNVMKKIRDHDLAKLRGPNGQFVPPVAPEQPAAAAGPKPKMSWEDFKKEQDKIIPLR